MSTIKLSEDIFIIDGVRTIMSSPYRNLKSYTAVDLATHVIKELVDRNKSCKKGISEVVLGNVVAAGSGQNIARQAAVAADLPTNVLASTINNVCGSGIEAIKFGTKSLIVSNEMFVVAGGTESATNCPQLLKNKDVDEQEGKIDLIDSLIQDGLYCNITNQRMGEIVEKMAKKNRIRRVDQDEFSYKSHQKAVLAQKEGIFKDEIVPLKNSLKKLIDKDDRPRKRVPLDSFEELPPAFSPKGSVTAGNSSTPADGAAVCLLASQQAVNKFKMAPKAKILGFTNIYIKPEQTFESLVEGMHECLKVFKLSVKDIDLFEIAESFAAPVLLAQKKLKIPDEKLNIYGGDIAFGHPLGAAGTRILVTLMTALRNTNGKLGLACISYGGGGASAILIEAQ